MSPSETHGPMMPPPLLRSDHGLFLDFDGTLADLQEDASAVVLPQSGPQTLRRVSDALSGALAIISGRALADLSLRVPDAHWRLGAHGLEIAAPGRPASARAGAAPEALRSAFQDVIRSYDGVWLEDKGRVQAVHYRMCPQAGPALLMALEERLNAFPDYRLQHGKMVIEAKPAGANKGLALAELMRTSPFVGKRPIMVGDDATDEDAMKVALALGGAAIKVGEGSSIATYRLATPKDVWTWLEQGIT